MLPDQKHYIYANFSTKQTRSSQASPIVYAYQANIFLPRQKDRWNIAEPQATIAYLGRPFSNSHFLWGVTYQGFYSNEDYYVIPKDSYQNPAVYSTAIADNLLPTDNANKMNKTGHFLTGWAGYEFDKFSIGFKANRTVFNRTGRSEGKYMLYHIVNILNSFIIDPSYGSVRSRNQDYDHWDFTLGTAINFSEKISAGISIGFLTSGATQGLNKHFGRLNFNNPKYIGAHAPEHLDVNI